MVPAAAVLRHLLGLRQNHPLAINTLQAPEPNGNNRREKQQIRMMLISLIFSSRRIRPLHVGRPRKNKRARKRKKTVI
jgi:hypothetical protein